MTLDIAGAALAEVLRGDRELAYKLRGFTGTFGVEVPPTRVDFVVTDGLIERIAEVNGDALFCLTVPRDVLELASLPEPPPGYDSVSAAQFHGVSVTGDLASVIAPYMGAISRLFDLLRWGFEGSREVGLPSKEPLFQSTDTAVGRYVYITVNHIRYRMYFEEAGSGHQVLLLQHTAGADARQWRHQLADPEFQMRFRVIAYDLPYHGRSLPPTSEPWWSQQYRPTRDWLMDIVLAFMEALALEAPIFMGCSVGGQLALDLAAHHPSRFGAIIALNGTVDNPMAGDSFVTRFNDLCRDDRISTELYGTTSLNATSPLGPEPYRRELYWLYRSNFPGVYAGDNDYFLDGHDLLANRVGIDTNQVPVYALAGEYDVLAMDADHGSPAVAKHFPGVEFRELPGLGHFAPVDDPLRLREALLPIFDEIRTRLVVGTDR